MSDEVKEAIEMLEKSISDGLEDNIEIILWLVKKQQKEILALQKRNNDLERCLYDVDYREFIIMKDKERRNNK